MQAAVPAEANRKVTLLPSCHTFEVKPNQTILNAGLGSGFNLPYSCHAGILLRYAASMKPNFSPILS